jgi:hypothetical protein
MQNAHIVILNTSPSLLKDMTQAEIGFFVLLAGGRSDALFLAGDTAQAVAHGVDFRFAEIRSVVHDISGGLQKVDKPIKLTKNFRSHKGILRVGNMVLDQLHFVFPDAAAKMDGDVGLVSGPKPLMAHGDLKIVKQMVTNNPTLRVLAREDNVAALKEYLGLSHVFGLREAKGLEWGDVLILDFFADSAFQPDWKKLLVSANVKTTNHNCSDAYKATQADMKDTLSAEMELELKLLYTSITRSSHRLYFVETKEGQASKAWFRCLHKHELGTQVEDVTALAASIKGVMTEYGWVVQPPPPPPPAHLSSTLLTCMCSSSLSLPLFNSPPLFSAATITVTTKTPYLLHNDK